MKIRESIESVGEAVLSVMHYHAADAKIPAASAKTHARQDAQAAKMVATAVALGALAVLVFTSFWFTLGMTLLGVVIYDTWRWSDNLSTLPSSQVDKYYRDNDFMKNAFNNTILLGRLYDNPGGPRFFTWLGDRYSSGSKT